MKTILAALLSLSAFQCAQAQWTIQNSPALPNSFIYQVEAVDANTAWAASPFMEVVKTTDSGLTWDSYPITDPVFTSANVTAVSALDANTAWIIVGEMGQTYFSRIYRTTDGGQTWQHQPTAYSTPGSYGFHLHFFDANNGVALGFALTPGQGSRAEIITTSNGGLTWNAVSPANMPAIPPVDFMYNTLTTVGNTVWVMDINLNILKSVDQGRTWVSKTPGFTQPIGGAMEGSLAFSDANNGLTGFNGELLRTTDGGSTWTNVNSTGTFFPFRIIPVPGTSLYLSSSRDIANAGSSVSYDNGNTWVQLENSFRHFDMEFVDANTGFSGGFNQMHRFRGALVGRPEEVSVANNYTISPNPGTGIFTVSGPQLQNVTVEVYNVWGSKVFQKQSSLLQPLKIDIRNQAKGVYIVRIAGKGQVINRKIILQ